LTDINQLSTSDTLTAGDLLPIWRANNSDTRKTSLTTLQAYMQANLSFSTVGQTQFVVQYAAPVATGFTVTLLSNTNNQWLILTPLAAYAAGTITFPLLSTVTDNQEIIIFSTQAVTTLTLSGNGASIVGAPTGISQNGALRFKFNSLASTWYVIGSTNTSGQAFLATAQTFTAQQTLTSGLVLQSIAAASIAAVANAINTTGKVTGKVVYDTTNNRLMVSSGSAAASPWYIADGSASVTPS
jgi:hypothetical protein